jgi:hypothetical protein
MITYVFSIGAVLWRRIAHPETLPSCRWSLGRAGVPINICGVLYAFHAFFWCFWPESKEVAADSFNWASVMFVGVFLLSGIDYIVRGRKQYKGPVVLTEAYKGE